MFVPNEQAQERWNAFRSGDDFGRRLEVERAAFAVALAEYRERVAGVDLPAVVFVAGAS